MYMYMYVCTCGVGMETVGRGGCSVIGKFPMETSPLACKSATIKHTVMILWWEMRLIKNKEKGNYTQLLIDGRVGRPTRTTASRRRSMG